MIILMNYFKQFKTHISNNDYSSFLSLWEEYCMGDEVDARELKTILSAVKKSGLASPFGRHVETILPLWEKLKSTPEYNEIFQLIIDLQTTNTMELGDIAFKFLKQQFGEHRYFNEMIRLVGLRERKDFQGAISNFFLLVHMEKGNYVYHTGGWGVGEIMDVSFLREQLSLEFDYVPGRKDMSFQNAFNNLKPIPNTHFLARRFGDPDAFEEFAKKNPVEAIRMLLSDLGPKTASEIKDELCELVIPADEWARWWQATRAKVKKDTLIETPSSLKEPFFLRESAISHEQELQKALDECDSSHKFIHTVYAFLRDFPGTMKNNEFREFLKEKLLEMLKAQLTDSEALQIYFFLEDISGGEQDAAVTMVRRLTSIQDALEGIEILACKKRFLSMVREHRNDWSEIFLGLLLKTSQAPLRDFMLGELVKAKHIEALQARLVELIDYPSRHPSIFLWYFNKIMSKKSLPFSDPEGRNRFFESFLILLSILENVKDARDLVKKMHAFITDARFANIRSIFQHASEKYVQEYLLLATKCHSIEDSDIRILHSLAQVVHPGLEKLASKYEEEAHEEEPIWTTEEGYKKLKERIHEIGTVETVDNAKEIETARAHGDLRENAEFKAALERRDRLQSELKHLSDQFSQARILTPDDVSETEVSVGTVVTCKDDLGKVESFTILGPFEANPEKGILSFQSKLAAEMLGKKVGDTLSFKGKKMQIESIQSFFEV